jgi:hypothetical protein
MASHSTAIILAEIAELWNREQLLSEYQRMLYVLPDDALRQLYSDNSNPSPEDNA